MIEVANSPSKLQSKLKLPIYLATLCFENGEFRIKKGKISLYRYFFYDFSDWYGLSARDIDTLCRLETLCLNLSRLKDEGNYPEKSIGLARARSLESTLIPLGLATTNGTPDTYILSPKAKKVLYVAELPE